MNTRPVIAVIGATGAQGGGLAEAILSDPLHRFALRALTRKPDSPAARSLAARGAEVMYCDLDAPDSIAAAFTDAHGVFAITSFWEHFSPERELAQAWNIAGAARRAEVRHIIWSTLEDTRLQVPLHDARMPTLLGRYKVPHLDAKGESDRFFRDLPTTLLRTSFFWDNLIHFGMGPQRDASGGLAFLLPMGDRKLPGIAAADIGACAFGLLREGAAHIGRTVGIAGEHLNGEEMAAALARALREPVRHLDMPTEAYARLDFPGAADLANMFRYKHDFSASFRAMRPVGESRRLHPGLLDFSGWLRLHAQRIPLQAAA
ncbi:MAG: NmrA/HSCARG family protein [Pseudomonadota bacterium]